MLPWFRNRLQTQYQPLLAQHASTLAWTCQLSSVREWHSQRHLVDSQFHHGSSTHPTVSRTQHTELIPDNPAATAALPLQWTHHWSGQFPSKQRRWQPSARSENEDFDGPIGAVSTNPNPTMKRAFRCWWVQCNKRPPKTDSEKYAPQRGANHQSELHDF